MNKPHEELLSAFFDGEVVAPEALEAALSQPDATSWLVDMARLRASLLADSSAPDPGWVRHTRSVLRPTPRSWWVAAAVAVVLLGATLAVLWSRPAPTPGPPAAPPRAVHEIHFQAGVDWFESGGLS